MEDYDARGPFGDGVPLAPLDYLNLFLAGGMLGAGMFAGVTVLLMLGKLVRWLGWQMLSIMGSVH